jgi:hypothetical protein
VPPAGTQPERWIVIPNWERFQHYKDRTPPWIKVYPELLHNDAWLSLTDAQKGLLLTIWLEYAYAHGQLRASRIPTLTRPAYVARTLKALSDAGFIRLVASKPLALTRSREKSSSNLEEKTRAHAGSNNNAAHAAEEPQRDPEAVAKLAAIAAQIGRPT